MTEKKEKIKSRSKEVKSAENKINNSEIKARRIKKLFKKQKRKISYKRVAPGKKEKLSKHARRTKWAPVWVVLKKFGKGKRIHPSAITRYKRSWRKGKLHIRPRKARPLHYG